MIVCWFSLGFIFLERLKTTHNFAKRKSKTVKKVREKTKSATHYADLHALFVFFFSFTRDKMGESERKMF